MIQTFAQWLKDNSPRNEGGMLPGWGQCHLQSCSQWYRSSEGWATTAGVRTRFSCCKEHAEQIERMYGGESDVDGCSK
jgi:hypothetical protein